MEEKEFLKELFEGEMKLITKKVNNHGTSGAVYLPKKLVGKNVTILVKEDKSETREVLATTEESAPEDIVTT